MNSTFGIFDDIFEILSSFGASYFHVLSTLFNAVFRKPLFWLVKVIRRTLRMLFRFIVVLSLPYGEDSEKYCDAVTKAFKNCVRVLASQPASLPAVVGYYVRKAFTKYNFGIKTLSMWIIPFLSALILFVGFNTLDSKNVALKITAGGEIIGYCESEAAFISAKNSAEEILLMSGDSEISLPEVSYSLTLIDPNEFTDASLMSRRLLGKTENDLLEACAVFADGELICVLNSENEARQVLDGLLAEDKNKAENYTVSFSEEIEFIQGLYPENAISSKAQFYDVLTKGNVSEGSYEVKRGDTLDSIASQLSLTKGDLLRLNPSVDEKASLSAGTVLRTEVYSPLLTVKEVRTEVTAETVDYGKIEIQSNALYSGSTRILSAGKPGFAQVTSFVTYVAGEKISASEVSRLTVSEAVPERIQVGIKPLDEAYSNSMGGIFLWPVVGAYGINSDYGQRWGKLHGALDIGMGNEPGTSMGKTIVAVAQGTCVVASVHSSYGYYVMLDHGNGLQTLYAHCYADSLMVVPGQVVVAGQPIAKVGSTGYSTGPHLHFEVRVNGNRVNPRPYLGI